jgi:hypothetical protein
MRVTDPAIRPDPFIRFLLNGWSATFGDRPGHPAAMLQVFVGSINYSIHFLGRNVAFYDL